MPTAILFSNKLYILTFFAQAIARNLGIKYDRNDPLFRGQTYFADVALANGYVDAYGTLEDAIVWVLSQATLKRANEII